MIISFCFSIPDLSVPLPISAGCTTNTSLKTALTSTANSAIKYAFKPKRKQERTFHGFFWVADTTFAIKKFELRISSDVNLNLLKDMIATYEYNQVNDTTWFLTNEDLIIDFNVAEKTMDSLAGKLLFMTVSGLTGPFPIPLKKLPPIPICLKIKSTGMTFWQENRKYELTEEDSKIYTMVDSIKKVPMYKTLDIL